MSDSYENGSFLRVGIIGAGQAGERHAAGFAGPGVHAPGLAANTDKPAARPPTRVVGVADLDASRAAQLAAPHQAAVYTDWRALLATDLDIVVIALPHTLHLEPALAAAQRGLHIMLEKPIATTLADGRRIVDACTKRGVKLATSFVHRFRTESQLLYDWVRSGALGEPSVARETMNIERGPQVPAWVMTRELGGGGAIMYSAVHGIDRMRWLVGSEVVQVCATTHRFDPPGEVEDGVAAHLTFANGAAGTLMATAPTYPVQPTIWESELIGTRGMGRLRTRQWAQMSNTAGQRHETTDHVATEQGEHYNFVRQSAAFVRAIQDDSEPLASGRDGLAVLAIALAMYASAEQGRPIDMGEFYRPV